MSSIADMMTATQSELEAFAQLNGGGHCVICSDLVQLWGGLLQSPTGLRILLMYNGEQNRDTDFRGTAILGRVDRRFLVVVTRGRSISVNRGDPLVSDTTPVGTNLFTLVEQVRDICRCMLYDPATTERPVDFESVRPFNTEGAPIIVDAYQIEFSVGVDIGTVTPVATEFASPV